MRVNVYAEEMTDCVAIISKEIDGRTFTGVRFYLQLPATVAGKQYRGPFMHRPGDDDSAAVAPPEGLSAPRKPCGCWTGETCNRCARAVAL